MKIVFMGTPDFSVPALDALIEAGHEIICVYTQPPRPAGRGKKDRPSPVHARAEELGLEVRHPISLKSPQEHARFAALGADVAVVVAYGLILPNAILQAPQRGCLNIHASLLPRWRGAAPIQRAIMAGDAQTGVTIMQMEAGLDTGPMLSKRAFNIEDGETAGELHNRLAALGASMIVDTLERLDGLVPEVQPEHGVTYASKIDKSEAAVDWMRPAEDVARHICGLSPFPGAFIDVDGQRIKLLRAEVVNGTGEPGEVLEGFTVACGTDAVRVLEAQRQGKRAMRLEDFLRGFSLPDRLR